ncbi:hypothetical protein PR048_029063 [Dryococelus australis]|uniref:DDE Tnp4 domain-containing protein n=1 Tax=Dryococelus australis TaxID=614101 RepID=A0ABQ9GCA7_9NEOP|nr:hypothetical protein PR048_029063 [Dryococelus australis]
MRFETVSHIVNKVPHIITRPQPLYMLETCSRIPKEAAEEGFYERWQFPNRVGSIDWKQVTAKCPPNTGSAYFFYEHKFPIVLLSIVGPDYKFICVDVGGHGNNSDAFTKPKFADSPCLIDDKTFSLSPFLMKPFPQRTAKQKLVVSLRMTLASLYKSGGYSTNHWKFQFNQLKVLSWHPAYYTIF